MSALGKSGHSLANCLRRKFPPNGSDFKLQIADLPRKFRISSRQDARYTNDKFQFLRVVPFQRPRLRRPQAGRENDLTYVI